MMKAKQAIAPLLGLASVLAVVGCTSHQTGTQAAHAGNPDVTSMPRAERLAVALADAENAHDAGENAKLARLLRSLRASGIRKADESDGDVIETWAMSAGMDTTPFRGRLLGPAYKRGELAPGESWRSAQTFVSGKPSTLAVSHNGAGPVRVSVSDQTSRFICRPDVARKVACRFTPLYTQRYDIELINEGSERAVYYLVFD